MKRIICLLLVVIAFASCTEKTVSDVTSTTEVPLSVLDQLEDSSLVFNDKVLESEDKLYIVNRTNAGKSVITKVVDKELVTAGYIWLGVVLACICFLFIGMVTRD